MEKSEVDKWLIVFGTGSQGWIFSRNSQFGYKTYHEVEGVSYVGMNLVEESDLKNSGLAGRGGAVGRVGLRSRELE